jgi:hypothetical protein
MSEVRGQRSVVGGRKSDVRCQMSDVRCQMSETGGQISVIYSLRLSYVRNVTRERKRSLGLAVRTFPVTLLDRLSRKTRYRSP